MILASSSPRRKELLERAGLELSIEPADIDETRLPHEAPSALVERLAIQKARAVRSLHKTLVPSEPILGADTIVWIGHDVLGKPCDAYDAARMLHELSGVTHHVSTGVCLILGNKECSFVDTTDVTFRTLTDAEIDAYVETGEPMDKAGAYAIQGGAGAFVSSYAGDYNNVVGLPVEHVLKTLEEMRTI